MKGRQWGFTLIEMIVALALVSMIMLGLLAALQTMGKTSATVATVSQRVGDLQLIQTFLGRIVAGARNLSVADGSEDGGQGDGQVQRGENAVRANAPYFEGRADRMRWVGVFPARHGVSGMHLFELSVIRDDGDDKLVLAYAPYGGANRPFEERNLRRHLLLEGVTAFRLAYQGDDPSSEWLAEWGADEEALPARVKLLIGAGGRYWPELIYAFSPL